MLILCYCSLLQHATFCRNNICFFSMFTLSRQIFLWLFNTLSCKVYHSVHSMSRHSHVCLLEQLCYDIVYVQLLQNCVATQFLCRDNISVGSCCNNVSCSVSIPVTIRNVYHDRVLSPLNPISFCSFIFML